MTAKKALFLFFLVLHLDGFSHGPEEVSPVAHHAHSDEHHNDSESKDFNPKETIIHHILDAHDWHFFDYKGADGKMHPVSLPLPIILYTEGHLDLFMSSAFDHGHASVVKGDRTYKLEHNHIIETSGKKVYDFSITKNATTLIFAALLLLIIFTVVARNYKQNNLEPKGMAGFLEPLILFVKEDIAIPNIGRHKHQKYLPYLLTLFFFIWIINLLGLIPGGSNTTGNISVTLTLSIFTMIIVNFSGNKNYWSHIFWPPVPLLMKPLMIIVELVGVISKPFALMIRLFANITAGHIVILSLISLVFIFKSVVAGIPAVLMALFISLLELLVAALQAYIFTLLTALFIGLAVEEHH